MRPELTWVRVRERLRTDAGTYDATRVQAWGLVDGRFAQAWIFAPVRAAESPAR
ncbi:MAG: hypothetical protein PGN13_04415 [Patulibacter minatonensis]